MAERQGFEPWIEFPLYTLSKRAPSTTRPSLRIAARPLSEPHSCQCIRPSSKIEFLRMQFRIAGHQNRPAQNLLDLFQITVLA